MSELKNKKYPSGLPGVGIPGDPGAVGRDGYSIFFTNVDISLEAKQRLVIDSINNNGSILFNTDTPEGLHERVYKPFDYIIDIMSSVYLITKEDSKLTIISTGYKYNSQNIFVKDTVVTNDGYARYHNQFFGDNKFVVDNIYTGENTNLQDIYNQQIYGISLRDFSTVNIVDKPSDKLLPFMAFSQGVGEESIAIVYDKDTRTYHFGSESAQRVVMSFDVKTLELPEDTFINYGGVNYRVLTYKEYDPGNFMVDYNFRPFSEKFTPDYSKVSENYIMINYDLYDFFKDAKPTSGDVRVNLHISEVSPNINVDNVIDATNYGSNNFTIYDIPLVSKTVKLSGLINIKWVAYFEFIDQVNGWSRVSLPIHVDQQVVNTSFQFANKTTASSGINTLVVTVTDETPAKNVLFTRSITANNCSSANMNIPINLPQGGGNVAISASTGDVVKELRGITPASLLEKKFFTCTAAMTGGLLTLSEIERNTQFVEADSTCPSKSRSLSIHLVNKTNLNPTYRSIIYVLSYMDDNGALVEYTRKEVALPTIKSLIPFAPYTIENFAIDGVRDKSYLSMYLYDGTMNLESVRKYTKYTTNVITLGDIGIFNLKNIIPTSFSSNDGSTILFSDNVNEVYLMCEKSNDSGYINIDKKNTPHVNLFTSTLSQTLNLKKESFGLTFPGGVNYTPKAESGTSYVFTYNSRDLYKKAINNCSYRSQNFVVTEPDTSGMINFRIDATPITMVNGYKAKCSFVLNVREASTGAIIYTNTDSVYGKYYESSATLKRNERFRLVECGEYYLELIVSGGYGANGEPPYNRDITTELEIDFTQFTTVTKTPDPNLKLNFIKLVSPRFNRFVDIPAVNVLNNKRWDLLINSTNFISAVGDHPRICEDKFYYLSKDMPLIIQRINDSGISLLMNNNIGIGNHINYHYPNYHLAYHNYLALNKKIHRTRITDRRPIGTDEIVATYNTETDLSSGSLKVTLYQDIMLSDNWTISFNLNLSQLKDVIFSNGTRIGDVSADFSLMQLCVSNSNIANENADQMRLNYGNYVVGSLHKNANLTGSEEHSSNPFDIPIVCTTPEQFPTNKSVGVEVNNINVSNGITSVMCRIQVNVTITPVASHSIPSSLLNGKFISLDNVMCIKINEEEAVVYDTITDSTVSLPTYKLSNWSTPELTNKEEVKFRLLQ